MITIKVNECVTKVISNKKVRIAIEERDKHKDYKLKSICSKIIRQESNSNFFRMVVRVGFDYFQKYQNNNIREDILVDISYIWNKKTNAEIYKVLNVTFVPELPNP